MKGAGHKGHDDNHVEELQRMKRITSWKGKTHLLHVCVTAQPWHAPWVSICQPQDSDHFTDTLSELFPWTSPPGVAVMREETLIRKRMLLSSFQFFNLPAVTILDIGLTWLKVHYHVRNFSSSWDKFIPQHPQKGCLLTSKKAMHSITFPAPGRSILYLP